MSAEDSADNKNIRVYLGTGSTLTKDYVTLKYPFEKYVITVKLTSDGRFVGIEEVVINKDFRSYKQSIPQKIFRDIDKYEPE
jgi:hypothetical protein